MFQVFDHTADLGLRMRAATREELFIESARALISIIVANPDQIQIVDSRTFSINASEEDYLLFDWLSEILYHFETERFLPNQFQIAFGPDGLSATLQGETFDPVRHIPDHEVKAITYHGLKVEQQQDGWLAEVIVDI